MNQAQHIWKMLDDMAASDPEAYKKFVEQNIKNGAEELKKEKQEKMEEMSITPEFGYSMKIYGNLMKQSINELEAKLSLKQNEFKQETFQIDKAEKRVKFYINLLHHDRVLGALDKNDQATDDPRYYNLIPLSVQGLQIGKSASFGTLVYFYDIVINSDVLKKINRQILQSIIIDTLQKRIELDRNPLHFLFYKAYYKFEIASLQIIKKQYKYCGQKKQIKILLEPQADKQGKMPSEEKLLAQDRNQSFTSQLLQQEPQQQQSTKKNLIEEIENDKIIDLPYQMTHEKERITIVINANVDNFKDIDLSISERGLKVTTTNNQNIELDFGCRVDSNNPSAKWDKKKRQLRIVVNKQL